MTTDAYRHLFPGSLLTSKTVRSRTGVEARRKSDLFELVDRRGSLRSAGVGGAITGNPADGAIIDDPFAKREDADSPAVRQKVWDWYVNDLYTRLSTDAWIVLTHTRWHRDDLAGRLLRKMAERDADQWDILSLPAIKGDDGDSLIDPRQPGEPLWPEFKTFKDLETIRHQDAQAFAALYQQDPAEAGGSEWPPEHFGEWLWTTPDHWPSEFDLRVVFCDPSKGAKDRPGDYSAIVFIGVRDGLVYVDADMDRRPPHRIVQDMLRMCDRYRPDYVGVEGNAFQDLLADEFERLSQGQFGIKWNVYKVFNKVAKDVRIRRIGPYLVNRELRFRGDSAGCRLLVEQLLDFPHADHDDGPDALEGAIRLPMMAAGHAEE